MSTTIKLFAILGIAATVAACDNSQEEEFVIIDPEPISVEPEYTGKYK